MEVKVLQDKRALGPLNALYVKGWILNSILNSMESNEGKLRLVKSDQNSGRSILHQLKPGWTCLRTSQ